MPSVRPAHADHPHLVAIFLAEQRHRAFVHRRVGRHQPGGDLGVLADPAFTRSPPTPCRRARSGVGCETSKRSRSGAFRLPFCGHACRAAAAAPRAAGGWRNGAPGWRCAGHGRPRPPPRRRPQPKWGINPTKIGIIGFSAGGHLASTEATHYKVPLIENSNNTSLRPDYQIVIYPVISMQDKLTHADSRTKLLGKDPSKADVDLFSNELQIDDNTPPENITDAADDKTVDVDNSINYFEKFSYHNISVEMHIYPKGGHGFIFRRKGWIKPLVDWMKESKWINN